ncbi:MAG: sugar ABC transporter substrate-binding protein [Pyrinomonadaceae bacterium]
MNKIKICVLLVLTTIFAFACVNAPTENTANKPTSQSKNDPNRKIKIGFAMDTLKEERWKRDHDLFKKHCEELNVECLVTVADNKSDKQANDVDNLLTQDVDVLVIAPHDATQAASMVDKAKAQGIPVISYDRLINSDKIDLYVSHQVPLIGQMQAEYALKNAPKGNYVMVYGASTDNNAVIMRKAQSEVLKTAIEKGDIKIVAEQHATDWKPEEALKIVENALTQNKNNIVAVVASNDGTAGGAIQALGAQGLTGKVVVTGQDAELAALQRIAKGTQTMTIYKSIQPLAYGAVELAIKLAKKETIDAKDKIKSETMTREVAAVLYEPVVVDKNNLMDTVIKDGWATYDEVYKDVPPDQRPKQ